MGFGSSQHRPPPRATPGPLGGTPINGQSTGNQRSSMGLFVGTPAYVMSSARFARGAEASRVHSYRPIGGASFLNGSMGHGSEVPLRQSGVFRTGGCHQCSVPASVQCRVVEGRAEVLRRQAWERTPIIHRARLRRGEWHLVHIGSRRPLMVDLSSQPIQFRRPKRGQLNLSSVASRM